MTPNVASKSSFQKGLEFAGDAVTNVEPLEKVTKVTQKTIDFLMLLTGKVSEPFSNLSAALKGYVDVVEGLCLFGRVKELACPDTQGKYFFQKSSWVKCADRICLTIASVFKTINSGVKFGFIQLGKAAKFALGRVPVLKLIPDTFVVLSSFFSIWENNTLHQKASDSHKNAVDKIQKWGRKSAGVNDVRSGDQAAITNLETKYQGKVASLNTALQSSTLNEKERAKKIAAVKKYERRIQLIADRSYETLAAELTQSASFKQHKWTVESGNQQINVNKAKLSIIGGVSKIFVITMATTGMALGLATAPWMLSLLAVGIVVDSIGLAKCYYDHSNKPQKLPMKPVEFASSSVIPSAA